jgi:hypothetical protein
MPAPPSDEARDARALLGGLSLALLALRVYAAARVGFGDSEALYASYALHPRPAYLDHPALVGLAARVVGGGLPPSPLRAHLVTAVLATAFPWVVVLASRACGATPRRSLLAGVVAAVVPETAIGLFALTPDLLLSLAWTAVLGLAAVALHSAPGSGRAAAAFACAGLLAGVAAASKVTGLMLVASLAAAYASRPAREHARTLAPWAGLAAGTLVIAPIVAFEARNGWPMFVHRLIDTQQGAGVTARNAGALVGGQLAYLSPLVAVLAAGAVLTAWRERDDAVGRVLFASFAVPCAALLPLCLWSRVAEPHWLAPALLSLLPAAARARTAPSRRLVVWSCALAGAMVACVHAWVLVPSAVRLAPASYDPRLDLGNELYGWPQVVAAVREEAADAGVAETEGGELAVVAPHWVICAQLEAALRGALPVGCDTPVRDDFDDWYPRDRWRRADVVVWVNDTRFAPAALPSHVPLRTREVRIERAGVTVRVFTITVLGRRAQA